MPACSRPTLAGNGTITPITPNVATTETAACWVVVTMNGRYTYTTNTGSNSISGYRIGHDGSLVLLDADGVGRDRPGRSTWRSRSSRFMYS